MGIGVASVYEAQVLVDAEHIDKVARRLDLGLDSLDKIPTVAVQLTLLRTVSAKEMSGGFRAAFRANGYNPETDPDLSRLERLITRTSEIKRGAKVVIVMAAVAPETDAVSYQGPDRQLSLILGKHGFKRAILSAWFGTPADEGLRRLKQEILGSPRDP